MKESPRRYTNPFLSDEENEKLNLWTHELEHSNTEHDTLTNSLGPSEFCEKETELYTDKNVMECEFPELLICYKEGAFHVKDICVDEGIPHGERFLFDENNNEMLSPQQLRYSSMEDYYLESNLCSGTDVKTDTGLPVLQPSNGHMNIEEVDADLPLNGPINDHKNTGSLSFKDDINDGFMVSSESVAVLKATDNDGPDTSVQPDERMICSSDNSLDNVSTEVVSNSELSVEQDQSVTVLKATENDGPDTSEQADEMICSSDDSLDNVSTEEVVSNSELSMEQEQLLPSLKSLLESIDQQPCQSPADEISKRPDENEKTVEGNDTLNLNNTKPGTSSEHVHNIEPSGAPKVQDMGSDHVAMVNQVHRGEGESSFSVAGAVPEHITYSGQIAFSGSTSLRSDSSTTSTRSFAFPILPNEWNSSPVRMAKADRSRLQKHRGWKHGLLCCRF